GGRGSIDDAANFVCRHVELRPLPLVDSFAGDEIDSTLWSVQATEGTAAEGDGTLTLSPDPFTGASIIVVSSNSLYDFTGGQATVQVNEVVGFGGGNNLFSIQVDGNNALEWPFAHPKPLSDSSLPPP